MRLLAALLVLSACSSPPPKEAPPTKTEPPVEEAEKAPATKPVDAAPPSGPRLAVLVTKEATWVGSSAGNAIKIDACPDGSDDHVALAATLCSLRSKPGFDAHRDIEISASDDLPYQRIVSIMDTANTTGFDGVSLADRASLSIELPTNDPLPATSGCGGRATGCAATVPATPSNASGGIKLPSGREALRAAPIVVVSRDSISLDGVQMAELADLPKAPEWKLVKLYEALVKRAKNPKAPAGAIILQADKTTSFRVLSLVIQNCYAAEYPNVMFAVNRR